MLAQIRAARYANLVLPHPIVNRSPRTAANRNRNENETKLMVASPARRSAQFVHYELSRAPANWLPAMETETHSRRVDKPIFVCIETTLTPATHALAGDVMLGRR